jgi:ribosomal protein S18 acetylase RimI-like enzyme
VAAKGNDRSPPRRRKTARLGPVVQVRRLHRRDLNKVWEFLKKSFRDVNLETVEYQRPRSKKRFFETYEEEGVEQLLFVVEGEIVAYTECTYEIIGSDTWINPRYFEKRDMRPLFVEELAVHPDWHGRGVGSFVLEQIQHLAKVRGLTHLVLEVAENNTHAMLWYRKRGFRKLDAAVFMAFSVDVAPELLPPRALEGSEEVAPDESAILAVPADGADGKKGEAKKGEAKKAEAKAGKPGKKREAGKKGESGKKPSSRAATVVAMPVDEAAPKPAAEVKEAKLEVVEPVDPGNGQRRPHRPDTAPPIAPPVIAPVPGRRRP